VEQRLVEMEQRTKKYEIEREQLRQKLDKSLNFLASLKDEQSSLS
jgi:DNA repair ATPase RecN